MLEAQLNRESGDEPGSRWSLEADRSIGDRAVASGRDQSSSSLCAHVSPISLRRACRPAMYGNRPRVVGLESCQAYRAAVPVHLRRWAPAGLFNCGTNTLLKLMRENCVFDTLGRHILWCEPYTSKRNRVLPQAKPMGQAQSGFVAWRPLVAAVSTAQLATKFGYSVPVDDHQRSSYLDEVDVP